MDSLNKVGNLFQSKLNQAVSEFFALDVSNGAVRVAQMKRTGAAQWQLEKYGLTPVDDQLLSSSSPTDKKRLGEAIQATIKSAGIVTKNVAIGLESSAIFSTTLEFTDMTRNELALAVPYQVENLLPSPLEESKLDWQLLGSSLIDPNKLEVLVISVKNELIEQKMDWYESLGLNVIAFEPNPIALTRAVLPRGATTNHILFNLGDLKSNLIFTTGENPRYLRTVDVGFTALVKGVAMQTNSTDEEAKAYILKSGFNNNELNGVLAQSLTAQL
jgi:type IV pilus assembly protein PilM